MVPELTIVMPYYNPGDALGRNVGEVVAVLERTGLAFEVIAVSDGSTDGSGASLDALENGPEHKHVRRIELARHTGKGEALRVGLTEGRGDYLGFIDADGDLPADLLGPFVEELRSGDVDMVLGSKRHLGSQVEYPLVRRLYSWGFQQLVRLLFDLDIRDTQTGIKVLRREVLEAVLPLMVEQRFAFDLELPGRGEPARLRPLRRAAGTHRAAVRKHDLGPCGGPDPLGHLRYLVAASGDPPIRQSEGLKPRICPRSRIPHIF